MKQNKKKKSIFISTLLQILWDTIQLIISIVNIFYVVLFLCFRQENDFEDENQALEAMNVITYLFFGADILFNLNRGIYEDGIIQRKRSEIVRHYLRNGFATDLIVYLGFQLWRSSHNFEYLSLTILFKIKNILTTIENMVELINLKY